jgi:SAM-dependent methyltransferase
MSDHWTESLFERYAELYIKTLEELIPSSIEDADGLENIFNENDVPGDGLVLDLACGIGRHSTALAQKGYRVIGLDVSETFLERARILAEERGVDVEFRKGDMRAIEENLGEHAGSFDAVINLFTSLGYYDRETDLDVFRQLYTLTKRDGILVIDIANRDWIIKNFEAKDILYHEDGRVQIMERRLDMEDSRQHNTWRFYLRQGEDFKHLETFHVDHILYSLHELKSLIEAAGWTYKTCYGEFDMSPFEMYSRRMIIVSQKQ